LNLASAREAVEVGAL